MARLFLDQEPLTQYKDRRFEGNLEEYLDRLRTSTTLYVGNVSFFTTEEQIHELFTLCGPVKKITMGLDKQKMTPCGFTFVEFHNRRDAELAVKHLNGTKLDDREIRIDFDWGFVDGRQFGRGRSGGQVRDEYRTNFDSGRGGYGQLLKVELERAEKEEEYGGDFIEDYDGQQQEYGGGGGRGSRSKRRDRDQEMEDADAPRKL